jgi:hypothetical protein
MDDPLSQGCDPIADFLFIGLRDTMAFAAESTGKKP